MKTKPLASFHNLELAPTNCSDCLGRLKSHNQFKSNCP